MNENRITLKRIGDYLEIFRVEESLSSNPSKSFRICFFLDENQKIDKCIFYDGGRVKPFTDLQERIIERRDVFFETVMSNPQEDEITKLLLTNLRERHDVIQMQNEHDRNVLDGKYKELSRIFINEVITFFGGLGDGGLVAKCNRKIKELQEKKKSNVIFLGELKGCGLCRHRSILFKLLCDSFGIRCRILRGDFLDSNHKKQPHMWNEIIISRNEVYIVDTMNFEDFVPSEYKNSYKYMGHPARRLEAHQESIDKIQNAYKSGDIKKSFLDAGGFGNVFAIENISAKMFIRYDHINDKNITVDTKIAVKEIDFSKYFAYNRNDIGRIQRLFEREIERLSMLQHPNIVKIFGQLTEMDESNSKIPKTFRVVMKKYDFNAFVFQRDILKKLSPRKQTIETLIFLLEVAKGLKFIHSFGIVHFDVKMFENVLLCWNSEKEIISEVVISDFGSSKEEKTSLNFTSAPNFTRNFAAPEVLEMGNDSKYTTKSDIYSYGKVMQTLFSEFYKDFPQLLEIEERCLSKIPVDRPSLIEIIYHLRSAMEYRRKRSQDLLIRQLENKRDFLMIEKNEWIKEKEEFKKKVGCLEYDLGIQVEKNKGNNELIHSLLERKSALEKKYKEIERNSKAREKELEEKIEEMKKMMIKKRKSSTTRRMNTQHAQVPKSSTTRRMNTQIPKKNRSPIKKSNKHFELSTSKGLEKMKSIIVDRFKLEKSKLSETLKTQQKKHGTRPSEIQRCDVDERVRNLPLFYSLLLNSTINEVVDFELSKIVFDEVIKRKMITFDDMLKLGKIKIPDEGKMKELRDLREKFMEVTRYITKAVSFLNREDYNLQMAIISLRLALAVDNTFKNKYIRSFDVIVEYLSVCMGLLFETGISLFKDSRRNCIKYFQSFANYVGLVYESESFRDHLKNVVSKFFETCYFMYDTHTFDGQECKFVNERIIPLFQQLSNGQAIVLLKETKAQVNSDYPVPVSTVEYREMTDKALSTHLKTTREQLNKKHFNSIHQLRYPHDSRHSYFAGPSRLVKDFTNYFKPNS